MKRVGFLAIFIALLSFVGLVPGAFAAKGKVEIAYVEWS